MNDEISALAQTVLDGQSWTAAQAQTYFASVVRGDADSQQLANVITAIRSRGQTAAELTGAARALLDSATPFPRPEYEFADIVGTGGDGHNTINLSTIAAITTAACGYPIIKHGNRSITSCSGSFDLLQTLGIEFEISPEKCREQVDQAGICFLFAPRYHPGLRHAAEVRQALQVRTIFNLLGPLVNPARPPRMLVGVADPDLLEPVAETLVALGCQAGAVVHGSGVDEVAIHGPTRVVEFDGNQFHSYQLDVTDFGAQRYSLEELVCHDAGESHRRSIRILAGNGAPAENTAVCVNAGLLMKQFGREDLRENFAEAADVLLAGKPAEIVAILVDDES